jgi:hypothetical protein
VITEADILEALSEAGEEELIALYFLVFPDLKVSETRIRLLARTVGRLAQKGLVRLGMTRAVAKSAEFWAEPKCVPNIVSSWLVALDDPKRLALSRDVAFADLRPVVVMT